MSADYGWYNLNSQKTPHIMSSWASYGVSVLSTWTKIDRIIVGLYCIIFTIARSSHSQPKRPSTLVPIFAKKRGIFFLAATKPLYNGSFYPPVRPDACPSVCHTLFTLFPSSYHHEIFRSYYQWPKWDACKRSRSEVKGQGHRGQNPT